MWDFLSKVIYQNCLSELPRRAQYSDGSRVRDLILCPCLRSPLEQEIGWSGRSQPRGGSPDEGRTIVL